MTGNIQACMDSHAGLYISNRSPAHQTPAYTLQQSCAWQSGRQFLDAPTHHLVFSRTDLQAVTSFVGPQDLCLGACIASAGMCFCDRTHWLTWFGPLAAAVGFRGRLSPVGHVPRRMLSQATQSQPTSSSWRTCSRMSCCIGAMTTAPCRTFPT